MIFIILLILIASMLSTYILGFIESLYLVSCLLISNVFYVSMICARDTNKCKVLDKFKYPLEGYLAPFDNLKKNGMSFFIKNIFNLRTPYIYNFIGIIFATFIIISHRINKKQQELQREREKIAYEKKLELMKKQRLERYLRKREMMLKIKEEEDEINKTTKNVYIPEKKNIISEEDDNKSNSDLKNNLLNIINNLKQNIESENDLESENTLNIESENISNNIFTQADNILNNNVENETETEIETEIGFNNQYQNNSELLN